VSLPHAKRERPPDGSISVARLRHKPNRAARKAFDRAQKFSGAGDYQQAASELQKAIAADDLYSEAHANLGVQYMKLSKFNEAVVEFRRAIALDQGTGAYYSNLALALAALHQVSEATTFARRGLDMDAANHKSQMVLGWVLASQPETRLAAIPYLEEAARGIPAAHRVLADLYRLSGRPELAARELRQYQATSMQHQPSFTPPEPGSPQREADALTASAVPRP
jgi:tetratricopeptide (TPR) repeat protein